MEAVVMVAGFALEATAWWVVAFRHGDVWRVTVPALATMGVAALLIGPPAWSDDVAAAVALGVGIATGIGLYLATRLFVVLARGWDAFNRASLAMYLRQGSHSVGWALAVSLLLAVPGEELFWRGLFQQQLGETLGGNAALAAVLAWIGFVVANLPSANLAIIAGAVTGGALWVGLGWWSGGVAAPLASHLVWTGLMLAFPVVRADAVE
jgi:membrane protease YdiL (CAAX protease family)